MQATARIASANWIGPDGLFMRKKTEVSGVVQSR